MSDDFAVRVIRTRGERGLKADQLAEKLETGVATVYQWERGAALPGYRMLIKLAQTLGVSTDYLCGLKDKP